ncbi:hypothetical protein HanRHA438_Chr02g0052251 [Helianthus annuus]|nr:hypothetical protein HanIR_Chr02g0057071 [Helianthus annuus]KAJ0938660.1 hypothetical protein HanRHA438_Chr02g0052251 [Helianthus annuus]
MQQVKSSFFFWVKCSKSSLLGLLRQFQGKRMLLLSWIKHHNVKEVSSDAHFLN